MITQGNAFFHLRVAIDVILAGIRVSPDILATRGSKAMDSRIYEILDKIKVLEHELVAELQKKEVEFLYEVKEKKVKFQQEVKARHRLLMINVGRYLREANMKVILTAPVIYSLLFPAVLMDLTISIYQAICFPIYRIPKVVRGDYIVIDRHNLRYLNTIEKFNCVYCGYFNGLIGYTREIAARTEQYWCPIKHARRTKAIHSRYQNFLEFGDAEGFRKNIEKTRHDFSDLEKKDEA